MPAAPAAVPVPAVLSVTETVNGLPARAPEPLAVRVTTELETVAVNSLNCGIEAAPPSAIEIVQEAEVSVSVVPDSACWIVVATWAVVTSVPIVTTKATLSIVIVAVSFCAHVFAIVIVYVWRLLRLAGFQRNVAISYLSFIYQCVVDVLLHGVYNQ